MHSKHRTRELVLLSTLTLVVVLVTTLAHLVHVAGVALTHTEQSSERTLAELLAVASSVAADAEPDEIAERVRDAQPLHALARAGLETTDGLLFVRMFVGDERVLCEPTSAAELSMPRIAFADLRDAFWPVRLWRIYTSDALITSELPIARGGAPLGRIECGTHASIVRDRMAGSLGGALVAAAIALVLSFVVSWIVTRAARKPLRWLGEQIDRLRAGQYDFEIADDLDGDVRELAGRIRSLGVQLKSERLAMLGERGSLVSIMDALEDAVALLNREGGVVFFNAAFASFSAASLDDVVGRPLHGVLPEGHPLLVLVEDASTGASVRDLPCQLPVAGRFERALVTVQHVSDDDGEPAGVVVLVEDLGVLGTLNDLVASASRTEVDAARYAEAVHEVKNPLNAINLNIELARTKLGGDSDVRPILDAIGSEIRRVDTIVRTFLEFVRPLDLVVERVPVSGLLSRLERLIAAEARSNGVAVRLATVEPDVAVAGDGDRLFQVLLNLAQNALEAMPEGGELCIDVADEGDMLTIRIIDEGVGLSDEQLRKVFDLYFTTKRNGSGIGLAIVSRIVNEHGGRVQIESAVDEGTRVAVQLPRWVEAEPPAALETSGDPR